MRRRLGPILLALALLLSPAAAAAAAGQIQGATALTDIAATSQYWDIVQLVQAGIVHVPADGLFHPTAPVTRLQFADWLARGLQLATPASPPAEALGSGIPATDRPLVAAVLASGVMQGVGGGHFGAGLPMTRAQVATIIGRDLVRRGAGADARYFAIWEDGASIPAWALPATAAMRAGLVTGVAEVGGVACRPEACFAPFAPMDRASAAAFLAGYLAYVTRVYGGPPLAAATPPAGGFAMGFWDSGTQEAYGNLSGHGATINYLVDGGYDILPGGVLSGFDNAQNLAWARAHPGTELWMMVQALTPEQDAFLGSPAQEAAIASGIAADVRRVGYAGVNLDVEEVPPSQGAAYSAFVAQVATLVHAEGARLSVDVPAPFSSAPGDPMVGAFDYRALGAAADQVVVMAYSYHWPGTRPGPVAPLSWEQYVLSFAAQWVPPSKLLLGLPAYGYIWNDSTLEATAYWISGMQNEAAQHGAVVLADPTSGEDTFSYPGGTGQHTGWYVGGRGLTARIALAHQAGWGGVVAWRLDYGLGNWWPAWAAAYASYR